MTDQTERERVVAEIARIIRANHRTIVRHNSRSNEPRRTFHNGDIAAAEAILAHMKGQPDD